MTLYWLSQNGDAPQGPLLPSQLRIMRDEGRITAEDLICADGAEEWQPAASVLGDAPAGVPAAPRVAPQPIAHHRRREGWVPEDMVPEEERPFMKTMIIAAILVCLCAVVYIGIVPLLKTARDPDKQAIQRDAVKYWARATFRDSNPQLLEMSESLEWYDGDLRLIRVRVSDVVNTYVIQFAWGTRQVTNWWTPAGWQERFGKTDQAVTYADTARAIYGAYEKPLTKAETGSSRAASKP